MPNPPAAAATAQTRLAPPAGLTRPAGQASRHPEKSPLISERAFTLGRQCVSQAKGLPSMATVNDQFLDCGVPEVCTLASALPAGLLFGLTGLLAEGPPAARSALRLSRAACLSAGVVFTSTGLSACGSCLTRSPSVTYGNENKWPPERAMVSRESRPSGWACSVSWTSPLASGSLGSFRLRGHVYN